MNRLIIASLLLLAACHRSTAFHPQQKNIIETVYASGKIVADSEYTVYALSAGTVIKKFIKEGDTVKRGQVLYVIKYDVSSAKLDAAKSAYLEAEENLSDKSRILTDLKLAMENAEAKFANDSLLYARRNRLWQQGIGTQNDVDNAYTVYITSLNQKKSSEEKYFSTKNDLHVSLANAKSQLAGAKNDLDNYFVRSDNDGQVYQAFKEIGEAVKINDPIAVLGKSSDRIIRLAVDQQDIDKIKSGQEVLLRTDITGNKIYHGAIERIYPMMNESDQTFRVDALFTDSTHQPYTHSSVEANIIIKKKNNVLTVPRLAMVADDSVLIRENGKSKTIAVRTGIRTLDEVEIIGGLTSSSEVLMPQQK
ncbi:MAG: HlyD family efflux transporter periplasmic adaptor subunit [Bacteroidetes bacterium]|nr:HlyD family efflux transporter periplasmic adaptor subunit [Bacteroidota bacterium]